MSRRRLCPAAARLRSRPWLNPVTPLWTWSGDIDSTSNPLVIDNVTKSMSISAVFTPVYTVTFTAGPGGSLIGNVSQTVVSGGSTTSVEAVAESGYSFVTWSGDIDSTSNPLVIDNVTKSMSISAVFTPVYTVTFTAGPGGSLIGNVLADGCVPAAARLRSRPWLNPVTPL